jgi:ubiquinone/menaquinone biosynthesis C-methylase UbiE
MNKVKVNDQLHANYENYYKEGDSEWRRLGAISKVENIVTLCRDLPRESMLEIGAGEGSILSRLSDLSFFQELYALEISPTGVETIKNKNIPRLLECKLFDGYNIPFNSDRFNIAILSHVVEHVEHPRQLLYEASRVAKYVFVEVPLEDTIRLPRDFILNRVGHINFYSAKTIRRLIQSCHLRIMRQINTNPSKEIYTFQKGYKGLLMYYIKQSLLAVLPNVSTRLFCYHGAIICERVGHHEVLSV